MPFDLFFQVNFPCDQLQLEKKELVKFKPACSLFDYFGVFRKMDVQQGGFPVDQFIGI